MKVCRFQLYTDGRNVSSGYGHVECVFVSTGYGRAECACQLDIDAWNAFRDWLVRKHSGVHVVIVVVVR